MTVEYEYLKKAGVSSELAGEYSTLEGMLKQVNALLREAGEMRLYYETRSAEMAHVMIEIVQTLSRARDAIQLRMNAIVEETAMQLYRRAAVNLLKAVGGDSH